VGVAAGALIALVGPISFWLLATLLDDGIAPHDQIRPFLDLIGLIGWVSLALLGPLGIVVVGRSAGIRRVESWIAWLVIALPSFAALWFVSVAMMSGALGNPF
jgi:quinol-cytochrome oxidoreductase complex cytochrome b subunit